MKARYIVGDVFDGLAALPDDSVDFVMTSPPFFALRSYLPPDHPNKAKEIGSETSPGEFIDTLLDVVEACERVLAPHGSMCIELGDTYAGSGGAGGDYGNQGMREGQPKFLGSNGRRIRTADVAAGLLPPRRRPGPNGRDNIDGWPLDKSLCLIPEMFRFSLAYGFNPLTGRETFRWRARNVIRWCRPNPPVGALADKFRPATSDLLVVCKSRTRYFDLEAVRSKTGGPPLDWRAILTYPYEGAHYAAYPPALCETPIESMCPMRVCEVCGEPSRRITESTEDYAAARHALGDFNQRTKGAGVSGSRPVLTKAAGRDVTWAENVTVGWSDCGHDNWRPGVVLDPFAGTGTTLAVATGHGRDAIGIDIDARNAEMALDRVGPLLLSVEYLEQSQQREVCR